MEWFRLSLEWMPSRASSRKASWIGLKWSIHWISSMTHPWEDLSDKWFTVRPICSACDANGWHSSQTESPQPHQLDNSRVVKLKSCKRIFHNNIATWSKSLAIILLPPAFAVLPFHRLFLFTAALSTVLSDWSHEVNRGKSKSFVKVLEFS